jgi:hypothetical protein
MQQKKTLFNEVNPKSFLSNFWGSLQHPVLLYDCHRSILFDYYYLGVPSIALQIILSRATSVGLCRGSQVPHCYTIP